MSTRTASQFRMPIRRRSTITPTAPTWPASPPAPVSPIPTIAGSPTALVLLSLCVVLIAFVGVRRLLRRRSLDPIERARSRAATAYERLLQALARRGFRKAAAQTPLEFARAVFRAGGDDFAPLLPITRRIYAARFGSAALEPRDLERIDRFAASIRR